MWTFALFGAGAIGRVHAGNLAAGRRTRLKWVVDLEAGAAARLAEAHGARVTDLEGALGDSEVDAVIIATPGTTHTDFVEAAAAAGKHIFCEKPLGVDVARARSSLEAVERAGVRLSIGFHRRFDPTSLALRQRLDAGAIGEVKMLSITSQAPLGRSADYCRVSGGMFYDSVIHDMDMVRWLLPDEPVLVTALASCLFDPAVGEAGYADAAMVQLRTASGRLAQISNAQGVAQGYDQRLELLGSAGVLEMANVRPTQLIQRGTDGERRDPPLAFFAERYPEAYRAVLDAFVDGLDTGDDPTAKGQDGLAALILAEAAERSAACGQPVAVSLEQIASQA